MKSQRKPDLIFDLGLHKGEDANYYLKKGFRVVAVEANNSLTAYCRNRFKTEITEERLTIIEGAIAPASAGNQVTFYLNPIKSVWGTIYSDIAQKKAGVRKAEILPLTVQRIDLDCLFHDHGIPHYLKVDIEGADILILDSLRRVDLLPQFVSMEKLGDCLEPLFELGYRRFRIVPQGRTFGKRMAIRRRSGEFFDYVFEDSCSGPYGDDLDIPWVTFEECKRQATKIKRVKDIWASSVPGGARFPAWYDTHASL